MDSKRNPFSRRLLSTFEISDEILTKLKSKGFTMKSEIQYLSDSKLQSICDLDEKQLQIINTVVRNSHKKPIQCVSAFDLFSKPQEVVHTGSYSLDKAINGGVQVSKITQISSEGGAGKTQICMQCCVNVQLPPIYGGLSSQALYVDTENNLRPERIISMAKHRLEAHPDLMPSLSPKIIRSGVHLISCNTNSKDLIDLVVHRIEPFIEKNPKIRLIVIDSIAQHFRYDYKGTVKQRDHELSIIAQKLKEIAYSRKLAVLITNQVTYNSKSDLSIPALGKYWQSLPNIAVIFSKWSLPPETEPGRFCSLRTGNILRSNSSDHSNGFYFSVTENGIEEMMSQKGFQWHPNY